jgi:alpha-N-acetylglucosaminidase
MGNMSKLDGNLSQAYYDQTIDLAHQLVDRMNELGMSPIYNAFAGFVPKGIKRVFPDAELIHTGWDNGEYYVSSFISPETELFQTIATEYIKEWEAEFGKGEFYLADSFNEMKVPFAKKGTQERFDQIASYGKHLYNSIASANPDATWVLQGWMFGYQRYIWDPESIRALFSQVPDDKMLLLDLSVDFNYDIWESEYTWNYAKGIYGKKWIYSTTPNFGGRTCPMGDIDFYLNGHLNALNSPNRGKLIGLGSAPEGVENNEVIYEAVYDAAWKQDSTDVREWLEDYTVARYGKSSEDLKTYWEKMLASSYGMCSSRAEYRIQQQPIYLLGGRYDVTPAHFEGLEAFIAAADDLKRNEDYLTDLALNAGFYAFGKAELLASEIHRAYLCGDKERASELEVRFEDLMLRADRFFESNPVTRLERWIDFARQWGTDEAEADKYEMDARRLISVWGPGHQHDGLNDYACRMWSGLIRDYYLPRWKHFFEAKKQGVPFDFDQWEYKFVEDQKGVSEVEPYEDLVAAAKQLVEDASDIAVSQDELPGWTSFEMKDDKTRIIHMIRPEDYTTLKALRFTWKKGEDDVLLKKVQINGAGWVRIVKDNIDQVIGESNPVVEVPLDIKGDEAWQFTYLHISLENTRKGGDSNVVIEYVRK